jgi:hypothetical protein
MPRKKDKVYKVKQQKRDLVSRIFVKKEDNDALDFYENVYAVNKNPTI